MRPMMLAETRVLVPNTLPIRREAESSAASVVMPATKTVKYRYLFIDARKRRYGDYTVWALGRRPTGDAGNIDAARNRTLQLLHRRDGTGSPQSTFQATGCAQSSGKTTSSR